MSGRILIVDDVATNRIVMKVKLAAARYEVILASSGEEALEIARQGNVDVVLMDMLMPGASGAEICRELRADPATAGIPVILITAVDDAETRLEGLEAGADDFLSRPVDEVALLARVRSLLRSREEERDYGGNGDWIGSGIEDMPSGPGRPECGARASAAAPAMPGMAEAQAPFASVSASSLSTGKIAILCQDPAEGRAMTLAMSKTFREYPIALERDAALALRGDTVPDVFLIDADLGGRNEGLRLMSELRSRHATRRAGCVILLPAGDSERAATALDLGAADVSHRPIMPRELAMRLRTQIARKQRSDRMRASLERGLRMAVIDPLTGLYNRRYGLHHLERVAARCQGQGISAGVIMLDIDHFKAVNDTHGHACGDAVLTQISDVLRASLRLEDLVCRIGGEEFLAVLPDATLDQVESVARRLRRAVHELSPRIADGGTLKITVSMGVTMVEGCDGGALRAMERADRALYQAKEQGRDRIETMVDHDA